MIGLRRDQWKENQMSRLTFKETREIPFSEIGRDKDADLAKSRRSGEVKGTSYELFDLSVDEPITLTLDSDLLDDAKPVKLEKITEKEPDKKIITIQAGKQVQAVFDDKAANLIELLESSSENEISNIVSSKDNSVSVAKDTPLPRSTVPTPATETALSSSKKKDVSNFLNRFLSQKRSSLEVEPPPIEPSSETYLRLFNEDFQKPKKLSSVTSLPELNNTDVTDLLNIDNPDISFSHFIVSNEGVLEDVVSIDDSDAPDEDSDSSQDEERNSNGKSEKDNSDDLIIPKLITIHLFNLPYEITSDEVFEFLSKNGLEPKSILLGSTASGGDKKGMPLGSAAVEIYLKGKKTSLTKVLNAINGKICGNRPIRAQKTNFNVRKRLSFGKDNNSVSRYFEGPDISFKCNLCGQVGHRQQECANDPVPQPCHLCAGTNHEPSK